MIPRARQIRRCVLWLRQKSLLLISTLCMLLVASHRTQAEEASGTAATPRLEIQLAEDYVTSANFSLDGRLILTTSNFATFVCLWDTTTGHELRRFKDLPLNVDSAVFSPDGRSILTTSSFDKFVSLLDTTTGGHPRSKPLKDVEGALMGNMARVYVQRGCLNEAVDAFQQQMNLAAETGNTQSSSNAVNGLAICYLQLGKTEEAERLFEKRLQLARGINDKKGEGNKLNNLAQVYIQRRQFGPAAALLQQRIALAKEIGDARGEASTATESQPG